MSCSSGVEANETMFCKILGRFDMLRCSTLRRSSCSSQEINFSIIKGLVLVNNMVIFFGFPKFFLNFFHQNCIFRPISPFLYKYNAKLHFFQIFLLFCYFCIALLIFIVKNLTFFNNFILLFVYFGKMLYFCAAFCRRTSTRIYARGLARNLNN